jgi:hypothetical protein
MKEKIHLIIASIIFVAIAAASFHYAEKQGEMRDRKAEFYRTIKQKYNLK